MLRIAWVVVVLALALALVMAVMRPHEDEGGAPEPTAAEVITGGVVRSSCSSCRQAWRTSRCRSPTTIRCWLRRSCSENGYSSTSGCPRQSGCRAKRAMCPNRDGPTASPGRPSTTAVSTCATRRASTVPGSFRSSTGTAGPKGSRCRCGPCGKVRWAPGRLGSPLSSGRCRAIAARFRRHSAALRPRTASSMPSPRSFAPFTPGTLRGIVIPRTKRRSTRRRSGAGVQGVLGGCAVHAVSSSPGVYRHPVS